LWEASACFTREDLCQAIETVFTTRKSIERNANLALALEVMVMRLFRCRSGIASGKVF
jgi:hypothetical protein